MARVLDGAGVKRASVSSRPVQRCISDMLVRQTFFEGAIVNYQIVIPSFGTVQGLWLSNSGVARTGKVLWCILKLSDASKRHYDPWSRRGVCVPPERLVKLIC